MELGEPVLDPEPVTGSSNSSSSYNIPGSWPEDLHDDSDDFSPSALLGIGLSVASWYARQVKKLF
jgi:hypothetical protein